MAHQLAETGNENDTGYRLFFTEGGEARSIFHDVPLVAREEGGEKIFNMIVEIPRGTNAKMEISVDEKWNPIKQDVKKGKLRFVNNVYPWAGYLWNYGAFPQTWEDPTHKHPETGCFGDNDPLDVCEIGSATGTRGQVKQVKVLGVIALIDEGETDWKVIVIDVTDPLAAQMNDMDDVNRLMPGFSFTIYEWLRTYKMPAGKPPNEFAFDGAARNKAYALDVVEENHQFWKRLISGEIPPKAEKYDVACNNTTVDGSPHKQAGEKIAAEDVPRLDTPFPGPEFAPANEVESHVLEQQRAKPHGDSALAKMVGKVADAILGGSVAGLSDETGTYTIASSASDSAAAVGVYRRKTPHAFAFSRAGDIGELEMVAAAYGKLGSCFTYSTGVGRFSFAKADGAVKAAENADLPDSVAAADNVNGEGAPLAFLREQS
eukprot:TRINITY_DN20589_c0_g1_i1.p1 TRINITY_DN20589_c0_g1~~TRINITY_DN20589_c0_g1_i1.p1  ORF type:complete len:448 (+),score=175.70 TRINITY_DN20589_c0_g1_i1:50-1345(+)